MKTTKLLVTVLALLAIGTMVGCWSGPAKSPDVSDSIRKSLDQVGLKNVTVSQDRDKGIVTLGGQVGSDSDKSQAESLAQSLGGRPVDPGQRRGGPDCRGPSGSRNRNKSGEFRSGPRHREESGRCADSEQDA